MTENEKRLSAEERKQKIRERYKGVDKDELEVIPAREIVSLKEDTSYKRVAAYCRVSTDDPNQTSSYELQKNHYEEYIKEHPGWELVGIYADEGISGTSLAHREEFHRMLDDCNAGKIDLIITKSISRFARNTVDSISTVRQLAQLKRPVGVLFETENLFTLNQTSEMILTVLSAAAQEESHTKSEIMNISIEHRFSRGIFLTPELLGYDKDEDGNLVINEDEAETVKVIYYLYLNGFSISEIADLLTEYGRKTKLGNTEWNPGSIMKIIQNERHCGDVLARKTWTPSYLNHKSKKNNNDRNQYRQRDQHEAIVSREVFNAANQLQASKGYAAKNRPLPVLSVVDDGVLKGYVPVDKDWTGFSAEEYQEASESVYRENAQTERPAENGTRLNLSGYEIVRAQFFSTLSNPAMTISNGKMRFNTACLKKFGDEEYVELLLNTVERCIAIRPCSKDNPNAVRWGRLKDSRWSVSAISCRGLAKTLFDIMEWEEDTRYRFRGEYVGAGENKMLLFQLDEPEMIKTEEITLPPQEPEQDGTEEEKEEIVIKKKMMVFPAAWADSFGRPITSLACVNMLEQEHYAGNWDILRPAKEVEDYNLVSSEELKALMQEAERIMEGWENTNE
jgi:DNA invertase Pin-like site-specific DNA recombinase